MQDRFKFRCYHKIYKKIYDIYSITPFGVVISSLAVSNKRTNFEDCEIMQCTGLTDKNGKLIYEGDIVKVPEDYSTFGQFADEKYEVYYKAGGFRFKPKLDKKARGCWLEDDNTFEIIGNIYENSELLTGEVQA